MKRINIGEIIWLIILCSLTMYIYILMKSGNIHNYIHPNMTKYIRVALYTLMLLSVMQVKNIFTSDSRFNPWICVFFIPLFLGFYVYGKESEYITSKKVYNIQSEIGDSRNIDHNNEDANRFLDIYHNINSSSYVENGDFTELIGYISKDEITLENEFILSRVLMNCCAADSQVIGIVCNNETDGIEIKEREWVKVFGSITIDEKRGIPVLEVKYMESIEKPEQIYIYQ